MRSVQQRFEIIKRGMVTPAPTTTCSRNIDIRWEENIRSSLEDTRW